jgi:hypothetical protein
LKPSVDHFYIGEWEMKYYALYISVVLLIIINTLYSQTREQIQTALQAYDGGKFTIDSTGFGDIIDVDTSIGDAGIADGQIHDPYGTLRGCYLFIANTKDAADRAFAIGVFKNNAIFWMSDTLLSDYMCGRIFATLDLNNDSTVEILTAWTGGNITLYEEMWIYSWNGSQGTCINARDESGHSKVDGLIRSLRLVDIDGDGIMEIQGDQGEMDSDGGMNIQETVSYGWNGSLYDKIIGNR